MKERISNYFEFNKLGTSFRQETIAGLTTFLAMAYILFVNPSILSLSDIKDFPEALRMNKEAIFVATSLAAAYGSILMGIYAKYPIALAPGMGLNAFFAFNVVLGMGVPWQTALAGVFVSGIIFIILSLTGLRELIINAIPIELKLAIGSGIGFFITFVGLKNSGIIVSNPATFVSLGKLNEPAVLLTIFGLIITVVLMARKIKAGVFLGMIITAIAGMIFGIIDLPSSVVGPVPSIAPTFGEAIKHIPDVFTSGKMFAVVLTFFIVDFFDATGTLVAVANQAGLLKENKLERAGKALMVDATAVVVGSTLGTSTTTSYIESTAGVAAGGRTGFSAVVTGILFLLALFFAPLLGVVTAAVTSPALIVVGVLMVSSIGQIDWKKFEIAVPAFFTIIAMPLTYSIATGIAVGFIFYPISMIAAGKTKKIHPVMYVLFVVFLLFLVYFRE